MKHFVAYHKRDEWGPYERNPEEESFFTAKPFRPETLVGNRLWVIEGSGSPKRYKLVSSGIISRVKKGRRPAAYRTSERPDGRWVHIEPDLNDNEVQDITTARWFRELLRATQSFRNGFTSLGDELIVTSFERIRSRRNPLYLATSFQYWREEKTKFNELLSDLEQIASDDTENETTKKTLIDARLGQGEFRAALLRKWNSSCAVSTCKISAVLRASHIKPWRLSSNRERLDPNNGLLLAAHIDALFDAGLLTFSDDGEMIISKSIKNDDLAHLKLPKRLVRVPTATELHYLAYHRRHFFR